MRALVTGGTGFIGSHLARCLVEENVDVRNTRRCALAPRANATRSLRGHERPFNLAKGNRRSPLPPSNPFARNNLVDSRGNRRGSDSAEARVTRRLAQR